MIRIRTVISFINQKATVQGYAWSILNNFLD
jgi:hypothetical protein